MKTKLLSIFIVVLGILLSIVKHNAFSIWDIDLTLLDSITITSSILFILAILFFNYRLDGYGTQNSKKIKLRNFKATDVNEKNKFFGITIASGILIALYLGFRFKRISNTYLLGKAAKKQAEWQKEIFIQSYTANDGFFKLKGYSFNYEVFFLSLILIIGIAVFIWNTVYYEKLKNYLKSIRR